MIRLQFGEENQFNFKCAKPEMPVGQNYSEGSWTYQPNIQVKDLDYTHISSVICVLLAFEGMKLDESLYVNIKKRSLMTDLGHANRREIRWKL